MSKKHLFVRLLEICLFLAVLSQICPAQNESEGALRVFDSEGKIQGLCPLKNTDVKTELSGLLSRVTVTQTFQNPFSKNIEAVYLFSLPIDAAIADLTIQIGDRPIRNSNLENNKRFEGHPNIFSQEVADITPNAEIKVVISFVETLKKETLSFSPVRAQKSAQPNSNDGLISGNSRNPDSNNLSVDGLGANLGLGADDTSFSRNAGAMPTETASGGLNAVLDLSATSEVSIRSFGKAREQRIAGSQIDFFFAQRHQ